MEINSQEIVLSSMLLIEVNTEEGREHLTAKTMHAFKYVWDNYKSSADWFMKVCIIGLAF